LPSLGGSAARQRRVELPGEPRSPIDPDPYVCPLYGRCFRATDACKTAMPALREIMPGRLAACYFPVVEEWSRTIPQARPVIISSTN
jgi:oligopeptide/dipeptide ABC transporter ATP-binding protein